MKEDGAASALHPWTLIVACGENDVIGLIPPPHGLMAVAEGQLDVTIVKAGARHFAPAIRRLEPIHAWGRAVHPVSPVKTPPQRECANWSLAVTLDLAEGSAVATDDAGKDQMTEVQAALDAAIIARADVKICYHVSHAVLCCLLYIQG